MPFIILVSLIVVIGGLIYYFTRDKEDNVVLYGNPAKGESRVVQEAQVVSHTIRTRNNKIYTSRLKPGRLGSTYHDFDYFDEFENLLYDIYLMQALFDFIGNDEEYFDYQESNEEYYEPEPAPEQHYVPEQHIEPEHEPEPYVEPEHEPEEYIAPEPEPEPYVEPEHVPEEYVAPEPEPEPERRYEEPSYSSSSSDYGSDDSSSDYGSDD